MLIRRETERDVDPIYAVTAAAFAPSRPPGQTVPEARLIDELRAGPAWLPTLSLVAVTPAGDVIGHVLGTRGHVGRDPVLALGPLAVRPDHQRHGVGSALVHAVLGAADALGEPLVALMEIQASRLAARLDADGLPVPLPEQNRGRWDQLLIRRGFTALLRAQELGGTPGPYVLQAAIAACHARARDAAQTDWEQIALLYRALGAVAPSPVVELNRAVAVAMAFGPERGLEVVDGLAGERALAGYHHLPSVRGDLLARLGRDGEAAEEFRRAAALTRNIPERTVLLRRAAECDART